MEKREESQGKKSLESEVPWHNKCVAHCTKKRMLEDRDALLRVMVTQGKQGNARGKLSQLLAEGRLRR